jgi:D-sedoheptulose 7-phosphate isomerase
VATITSLSARLGRIDEWGRRISARLAEGGRVLAAGNGGSAAQAQHLTAELVGRYREERRPLSAVALHADSSTVTALVNDYGAEEMFARQVEAHGRRGDVLVVLSTSGRSPNVVAAAGAARRAGVQSLALTGPEPNPLADACDGCIPVEGPSTAQVQEGHLVVVHLLCEAVDRWLAS